MAENLELDQEAGVAPESEDRPIRECSICPPQVERCVHYDGKWIILHKEDPLPTWLVCLGKEDKPPEFREQGHIHRRIDGHVILHESLNHDLALVTFEEQAASLIGA